MKIILMFSSALLFLAPFGVVSEDAPAFAPGQVIVSFCDKNEGVLQMNGGHVECSYGSVQEYLAEEGITGVKELYHGNGGVRNIYLLEFAEDANVQEICNEMKSFQEIKGVMLNYHVECLSSPNDWYFNYDFYPPGRPDTTHDQHHLTVMQADKAWHVERGDTTVTIAIIDSGIDYLHPDLKANIWVNPGEDLDGDREVWDLDDMNGDDDDGDHLPDDLIGYDFDWNDDNNPMPDSVQPEFQHGTMMASVGAVTDNDVSPGDTSIAGIAWHCKLVPIKAMSGIAFGNTDDVIQALNYVASKRFDVANMSFYIQRYVPDDPQKDLLHEAVKNAYEAGVVLVGAIPSHDVSDSLPGGYDEVIECSVVDENGVLFNHELEKTAGYSEGVDVCGLGFSLVHSDWSFILTTYGNYHPSYPGSQSPHFYWWHRGSSSYASAQVSALAGLLRSMYPDSSPAFIKHEIQRGAIPVDAANSGQLWEGKLGAGRINPYRSLTQWGRIRNDTTWTNSVYVSADIQVDSGATLTIEPGTTINFAADDNGNLGIDPARIVLEVRGTLIAEGTAQHPIVFKSFAENPGPEDWYGIWFKENSSGSLSHCKIENAKYGLKHDSAIDIEDCEIIWEQYSHVWRDLTIDEGLTLTIKPGTTVYVAPEDTGRTEPDTMRVALDVKGVLNANGTADHPIIFKSSSDEFLPGDWYGILYADENSSGSLSHCLIQDARYGVESAVTIQIADCEITNCMTAGIYMYDNMDSNSVVNNSSTIRRCNIYDNLYPVSDGMRIWNCPDTVLVDSCTVTGNGVGIWVSNACPKITNSTASSNHYQGVLVTSYEYPAPYPYPVIKWCHMHGNGQEGIKCQYNSAKVSYTKSWGNGTYGILAYGVEATPTIDHSKMISNSAAGLRADSYAYPILGNASLGLGQNNSLYGPNQAKNVYNATSLSIYAQNCWWGSAPPDLSKFQGQVTYQPYLTSDPVYYLAPMRPKTPSVLSLEQNFPNPFNVMKGVTTIKYSIPSERDRVVLTIYDVSGRRVCTLVDRPHQPGYYYARWDGRNDGGARVAPGMYFCRMNVGKQCFTKKMVVLR